MEELRQLREKLLVYMREGNKGSFIDMYDETRLSLDRMKAFVEVLSFKDLIHDEVESLEKIIINAWFHVAVTMESVESLEYLFVKGEKPNFYESENGVPLLQSAVETRDLRKVELLLKNGADVNVELNNPVKFSRVMFNKPIPFKRGTTALHRAIVSGQEGIINLLLDHGADIFKADVGKDTAMHHAARMGDLKTVQLLYDRGAPIDGMDEYSLLPLNHAILKGHTEVVQFLLDRLTHNRDSILDEAFCYCARAGIDMVKILLDAGANVNAADDSEYGTCLHHAASRGFLELAELLLDRGAEIDFLNNVDETPLHLSITYDNIPTIKFLLRQGANINAKNIRDRTCLHTAATLGYLEIVEVLLDNQADFFARDNEAQTALSLATVGGYADDIDAVSTAKYLIKWMVWKQLDLSRCAIELDEINREPRYKDINDYLSECKEEMLSIKTEEIQTTSVRYYDVIDKLSLAQLVKLSRNENIAQAFEFNSLSAKFPIFAPKLHKPYQRAADKRNLLEKARRVFSSLYNGNDQKLPILPNLFTEELFEYLSDQDLINVTLNF